MLNKKEKTNKDEIVCFRLTIAEKQRVIKLSRAMEMSISKLFQTFLTSAIADALIKFEMNMKEGKKETIKL